MTYKGETTNGTVASLKAHITRAKKAGDWKTATEKMDNLHSQFRQKANGDWEYKSDKQSLAKITTPSEVEPPKTKTKTKTTSPCDDVNYDNPQKRLNRQFVAQNWEGKQAAPAKQALIMPGEHLHGVAQFYDMGLFDEDTQLICIEGEPTIFQSWQDSFGGKLRCALEQQYQCRKTPYEKLDGKDPILLNGFIGKRKNGEWEIPLTGLDKIDFVWLDFMGVVNLDILEWITEVLRDKVQWRRWDDERGYTEKLPNGEKAPTKQPAGINITANASTTTLKRNGSYRSVQETKALIEKYIYKMDEHHLLGIMEELETSDADSLPNEERKWEHWRIDNWLLQHAFGGHFIKPSDQGWLCAEPYEERSAYWNDEEKAATAFQDVQRYTGTKKNGRKNMTEMATHKFFFVGEDLKRVGVNDCEGAYGYDLRPTPSW